MKTALGTLADILPKSLEPMISKPVPAVVQEVKGEESTDASVLAQRLPAPLQPFAKDFIEAGNEFGVDPALLASISMHETGLGTSRAFREGFNAMGVSDSKGPLNYPDASGVKQTINRMAKMLGTSSIYKPYRDTGSIEELAKIYAPVGAENDPRGYNASWAGGVTKFFVQIKGLS